MSIRLAYFVRESFPTYRLDLDILFAKALPSHGHAIDFIMQAATDEQPVGSQLWRGCNVYVGRTNSGGGFLQRLHKHWLCLGHELRWMAKVSRRQYDAVQVRDKILIAAIGAPIARMRGLKFFYWLSFPMSESQVLRAREGVARYRVLTWLRGVISQVVLYRWIMPLSHHVFVQSEQMKRDVMMQGVPPSKLSPVPMGIPVEDVRARREEPGAIAGASALPQRFAFGYLGVLSAERRLDVLIDALALLRRDGVDAHLLFIGDGQDPQDRIRLERRAVELGVVRHVEITGFMPRAQALERMSALDVGVSPFYPTAILRSTSPTKLVEYFSIGLPVVANDHPEQSDVLRRCRGGVCVPWGYRHFARALRYLDRAGPAYRTRLGERGREWVLENRTYDRIADRVSGIYARL